MQAIVNCVCVCVRAEKEGERRGWGVVVYSAFVQVFQYCHLLRQACGFADFDAPKESAATVGQVSTSQPSQAAEEDPKLSVWIQDGQHQKKKFKLRRTDPFSKLMQAVKQTLVKEAKLTQADNITFTWEEKLKPDETPADLDWEDEEVVDIKW